MVKLITQIGPDLAEISRRLGIFKETVRYRYKGLLEKGFVVQVAPNYERMGLQRMISTLDFTLDFRQYAEAILISMSQLCYLSSFAKNVPSGSYTVHFNIPREHVEEVIELLNVLKGKGMFRSVGTYTFDSFRNVPMKADQFNFDNDRWDHDWSSSTHKPYPENVIYERPGQHRLDEIDLKIIEQLQYDANKSFTEIQEKVGVNYKTLTWHYRNHILENGLLKGYKVNWMGTTYDIKTGRALSRKSKYAFVELLVKDVSQEERMQLIGRISSMPFVWAEAVGANYYAQMPFPTDMIAEGLTFLEELLAPMIEKAQWSITDSTHALFFTLEPTLYDSKTRTWKFQMSDLVARFDTMLLQVGWRTS